MPMMQAMVERGNAQFTHAKVNSTDSDRPQPSDLVPGTKLQDAAANVRMATSAADVTMLTQFHKEAEGVGEAIRAVLYNNLMRPQGQRYGVQFGWAPGSYYEVSIWECPPNPSDPISKGGITIFVRTPYSGPK